MTTRRVSAHGASCLFKLTHEVDDPFEKHFAKPDEARLSQCIREIKVERWGIRGELVERPWHKKTKQPSTHTLYPVVFTGTSNTTGVQSMNVRALFLNGHNSCG